MTELTTPELTPAQRKELRARAHHLDPVVLVGEAGLTAAVVAEIASALAAHHLIKVRVFGDDRAQRLEIQRQICEATRAHPVQHIGKLLVLYRAPEASESGTPKRPRRPSGPRVPKKAAGAGVTEIRKTATRRAREANATSERTPSGRTPSGRTPARTTSATPLTRSNQSGSARSGASRSATPAPRQAAGGSRFVNNERPQRPGRAPRAGSRAKKPTGRRG